MAEEHDVVGRDAHRLPEIAVRGLGIAVETSFSGHSLAFTISSIVERQQTQSETVETGVMQGTVEFRQVPRIAVANQYPETGRVSLGRDQPAHQRDLVIGRELH